MTGTPQTSINTTSTNLVTTPALKLSTELQIPNQLRASNTSINKLSTKIYATASTNTDLVYPKSHVSVATECNFETGAAIQTETPEIDRIESKLVEQPKQSKVFNDLENFLKSWLSPPSSDDAVRLTSLTSKNSNKHNKINENNTQLHQSYRDSYLKKKTIKFLLDTYTNITLKENFSKIDTNNLAFINLNQMLNSPEFNTEVSSYFNYFFVYNKYNPNRPPFTSKL